MLLTKLTRAVAPIVNQQSRRALSIPALPKDIHAKLMTMRKRAIAAAIVELRPPTPAEIPAAIRDGIRIFTRGHWRTVTVREAWLNTIVTIEVVCWFFVGEVIGKGSLIGYQV